MEDYKHQPHYMYPSFKTVSTKNNLMNPGVHKLLTKMNHVQADFAKKTVHPHRTLNPSSNDFMNTRTIEQYNVKAFKERDLQKDIDEYYAKEKAAHLKRKQTMAMMNKKASYRKAIQDSFQNSEVNSDVEEPKHMSRVSFLPDPNKKKQTPQSALKYFSTIAETPEVKDQFFKNALAKTDYVNFWTENFNINQIDKGLENLPDKQMAEVIDYVIDALD